MSSALAVVMLLALPGVAVQRRGRRGRRLGSSGGVGVGVAAALPGVGLACSGVVVALVSWCLGVALPVTVWVCMFVVLLAGSVVALSV